MKFYKVKKEYDQKPLYKFYKTKNHVPYSFLIANELYTDAELKKFNVDPICFDVVEIPKNKTYWSFGARFESRNK